MRLEECWLLAIYEQERAAFLAQTTAHTFPDFWTWVWWIYSGFTGGATPEPTPQGTKE